MLVAATGHGAQRTDLDTKGFLWGELRTSLQEKSVPLLGSGHCSQEASQTGKSGDLGFTFKSAEEHEGYGAATSRQD